MRCGILDKEQRQYTFSNLKSTTVYAFHIESINRMGQGNRSIVKGRTEARTFFLSQGRKRQNKRQVVYRSMKKTKKTAAIPDHQVRLVSYGEDEVNNEEIGGILALSEDRLVTKEQTAAKTDHEAELPSGEEGEEIKEVPCEYVTYHYKYANEAEISEYESDDKSYN